ncbi:hypothetical protein JF634_05555 [Simonsiella muelleri]|uniref:hypothetical protein n=1 Tax=Simonsiella muelleri TaxID=72 RepID=UPI0012DD5C1E|nr:hypothetical protein [Simonsiella muelleri]UBQ54939.1 hypothetical protein JF634_05555 [Simonsiella muelleri]
MCVIHAYSKENGACACLKHTHRWLGTLGARKNLLGFKRIARFTTATLNDNMTPFSTPN